MCILEGIRIHSDFALFPLKRSTDMVSQLLSLQAAEGIPSLHFVGHVFLGMDSLVPKASLERAYETCVNRVGSQV